MARRPPLKTLPPAVRQRQRADGSWRVWWEPPAAARPFGFSAEELTPDTLGMRKAERLNEMVREALAGQPARPGRRIDAARTVRALIAAYTRDPHFLGLRPATQLDYRKSFALIERDWGDQPVAAVTKPAVRAWRAEVLACARPWQRAAAPGETRPWQAKALTVKLAVLMAHAELEGWIAEDTNPALRLDGRRKQPLGAMPPRSRVASWDELGALIRAARANGDRSLAVAIALATLTAQRQADILKATIDEFAAPGVWTLVRSKRGNLGRIALHPVAEGLLHAWRAERPASAAPVLLIAERTGLPWSADLFRKAWAAARRRAAAEQPGVATLQFRDLRRTFGHLARLGGADKADTGAVLGNTAASNPRLEITYMPLADDIAARAVEAITVPAGWMENEDE